MHRILKRFAPPMLMGAIVGTLVGLVCADEDRPLSAGIFTGVFLGFVLGVIAPAPGTFGN